VITELAVHTVKPTWSSPGRHVTLPAALRFWSVFQFPSLYPLPRILKHSLDALAPGWVSSGEAVEA
jgi:hypothetical protein